MSSYAILELDTEVAPVTLGLEGDTSTPPYDVIAHINVEDPDEPLWMKLWGSVDGTRDPAIQTTEATSLWLPYEPTRAVRLAPHGATSALHVRIRDDVFNTNAAMKSLGYASVVVERRTLRPVKMIERRAFTDPRYLIVGYDK